MQVDDRSTPMPPLWPRIRDSFVAPGRLVAQLRDRTPWMDVLIISTAIAMIGLLTMPDEVFVEPMREAVNRRGRPVEITSPPEEIARWGRGIGMLATLATHPVVAATLAGALTLFFSIFGRGAGTYRDYLSLTAHAFLIPAVGTIAAVAIRLAGGPGSGDLTLGGLAGGYGSAPGLMLAALLAIDPFIVWMLVVIGVGASYIDPRHSRVRSPLILLGVYFALVVASTAILRPEL